MKNGLSIYNLGKNKNINGIGENCELKYNTFNGNLLNYHKI